MSDSSQILQSKAQAALDMARSIQHDFKELTPEEMKLKLQELVAAMMLVNTEVKRVQDAFFKQNVILIQLRGELFQIKEKPQESPYYWEYYQEKQI